MSDVGKGSAILSSNSSSLPWLRALELTAPIATHRHRIFSVVSRGGRRSPRQQTGAAF